MKPSRRTQVIKGIEAIQRGTHFSAHDLKHQMVESRLQTPTINEIGSMLRFLERDGWVQRMSQERNGLVYSHGRRFN
jgi:hypothetical protein